MPGSVDSGDVVFVGGGRCKLVSETCESLFLCLNAVDPGIHRPWGAVDVGETFHLQQILLDSVNANYQWVACSLVPSVRATGAVDRGGRVPCTSDQLELARQSPCWDSRSDVFNT